MDMVYKFRDKARDALYRFTQFVGEKDTQSPESLYHSAQAKKALKIYVPQLKSVLPYEAIDENGFFHNESTIGFALQLSPAPGADESLVKALAEIFKTKLPKGAICTTWLYKHHRIGQSLYRNYAPLVEKGGVVAELAKKSIEFHMHASISGYKNSRNIPAQLADYESFIFVSVKKKGDYQKSIRALCEDWESELKVAGFHHQRLGVDRFSSVLRTILSPDNDSFNWPDVGGDESLIKESLAHPSTVYEVDDNFIDIDHQDDAGKISNTRLVNLEVPLKGYPTKPFALWQTPDLFANILKNEHGIQCPFLISFSVCGVDSEKVKANAKRRAKSTGSNANGIQEFLAPGLMEQAQESSYVHSEASKDNLVLMPCFYNVTLFTSKEDQKEHVAKAIASYKQQGFSLIQSRCSQWLRFLGALPFTLSEGLFDSFKLLGMTKEMTQHNVANLLPVVSDFKGAKEGLLLPTYRHQLFYYNSFDDKHLPISNYNLLVKATSGAGKSYLTSNFVLDSVSRGEQVFIIDIGDSYKHLCDTLGGTYIDASTLSLNPFTLFDFHGEAEIGDKSRKNAMQIRDLLAIMASPDEPIDKSQREWLRRAVEFAWEKRGNKACIDDVVEGLNVEMMRDVNKGDKRLSDLILLLEKYTTKGCYGEIFNYPTKPLSGNNLIVLELGALREDKELLKVAMFAIICIIQGQFYQGDRGQKKKCIIDEGWEYIVKGTNSICADFIEHGYRVCRKYSGSFTLITQLLTDTQETTQGRAVEACSDTKWILKQGDFEQYVAKNPDAFTPNQQELIGAFGDAKTQGFSSMMLSFSGAYSFHRLFSDPFSRILFSTSGDEFKDVEALVQKGYQVSDAVYEVSKKYYGETL